MKKFIPAVAVTIFSALLVIPLSGCFGEPEAPPVPKQATNVEVIEVPGEKNGFNDIVVFDIERDGQILTCTTKAGYNSGVGCVKKTQ
jgi:hypothetical protein